MISIVLVLVGALTPCLAATPVQPPSLGFCMERTTGTGFAERTRGWPDHARQAEAVHELLDGDMPAFLGDLQPVTLHHVDRLGVAHEGTIWVMPDYLSIGTDADFLRVPLDMPSAVQVAESLGYVLPTPRMVDAIYAQAVVVTTPQTLPPGPEMRSSDYSLRHRERVECALGDAPHGFLTAGHKKDVVLSRELVFHPHRVAIYGWHRGVEDPIQPLSTWHGAGYADYSHGIRLISPMMLVDGHRRPVLQVLADPELSGLLSDEGPLPEARALMRADTWRHEDDTEELWVQLLRPRAG